MVHLSSHKVAGVREAIEDTDAILLYLPPYSLGFNPIKLYFSKLKAPLRKPPTELSTPCGTLSDRFKRPLPLRTVITFSIKPVYGVRKL